MWSGLGTGEAFELAMNNDGNEEKTQDDLQEYNVKTNRDGEGSATTKWWSLWWNDLVFTDVDNFCDAANTINFFASSFFFSSLSSVSHAAPSISFDLPYFSTCIFLSNNCFGLREAETFQVVPRIGVKRIRFTLSFDLGSLSSFLGIRSLVLHLPPRNAEGTK